jgi:superfamily II DNA or RNA helicase
MVQEASTAMAVATEVEVRETPPTAPRKVDAREVWPEDETEASRVLLAMAHRKKGRIPCELLVNHVLKITAGGDWPLRRGAMEAVLRRCTSVEEGRFVIEARWSRRDAVGDFTVRRKDGGARSHEARITCVDPLEASCDCDDYLRNSLGLCKHVLAVLHRRRVTPGTSKFRWTGVEAGRKLRVRWHPVRPLTGRGDWLERLEARAAPNVPIERAIPADLRGAMIACDGGTWTLSGDVLADPERRLAVIEGLLQGVEGRGERGRPTVHAEPAVRALLAHERARLDVRVRGRLDARAIRDALRSLKRRLYAYQAEGVETFLRGGRLLLADDMGLGKTAQAIAACHVLFTTGKVRRGIVLAPASLKSQWLREWQLFTDVPARVVEGGAADRERLWKTRERGFLIANYEQVLRDLALVHDLGPDLVVLDEAQRIKNWDTKTARCVKELRPRYRLVLTGTPMENRLDELASVVEWVDDLALEPKWRLVPWHATAVDGRSEVGGARHMDTLRQRLAGSVLRRVREEVLDQLPSRTDTTIPVEFTPDQQDAHDAFNRPIAALVRTARSRPLTKPEFLKLMRLLTMQRIVCDGLALFEFADMWPDLQKIARPTPDFLRTLASPKLLELREIVRQVVVEQGRKIVVFSQWRRMLELAHWATRDVLEDFGARAAFFTGHESQQQRTRNVVDLHDDPRARVLFLTDCGGVGLNLQRAASCCVNLELPWNPAVLEQRIGRIHRLGQSRPIDVYNLVSEGGIESRIATLVEDKRALFKGLFDGEGDEIRYEKSGTFMGKIEKLVAPEPAASVGDDAGDGEDGLEALVPEDDDGAVDGGPEEPEAAAPGESGAAAGAPVTQDDVPAEAGGPSGVPRSTDPFAGVTITRKPDGGLVLDARPEAAATLATLFEGFAKLLRTASV